MTCRKHQKRLILDYYLPYQSQGKPKDLRPIILLSVLRKILTIIILRRIWPKLKNHIPIEQAAYQGGRSTTEQVFSIKVLCEKAIQAQKIQLNIKLIDMSKAFDTINRKMLFQHLEEVLDSGELYHLSLLTNKPKLKIKIENTITEPFQTTTGIMQGDCLSAVLFIFYLGKALSYNSIKIEADNKGIFYIEPKYADDITSATINDENNTIMNRIDKEYPERLKEYHLKYNESKTENHAVPPRTITKQPNPNTNKILWSELDWILPETYTEPATWKKCKLLGSRLDHEEDIKCRKAQTYATMKKLSDIFTSKHLSIKTKMKQFQTYISTIFLYNSELWALTPTDEKKIDSFHRRLLRQAINKKWPKKQHTNEELYSITGEKPWSINIKRRRLKWVGHLLRLDEKTPARVALDKFVEPHTNKVGRPKTTWLATVRRDLSNLELPPENRALIDKLCELASDRKRWRVVVDRECEMVRKD